jgi:hypothetical protein
MRKVVITIECENNMFLPDPEQEVAGILRDISDRLLDSGEFRELSPKLYDTEGNHVGTIRLFNWR